MFETTVMIKVFAFFYLSTYVLATRQLSTFNYLSIKGVSRFSALLFKSFRK